MSGMVDFLVHFITHPEDLPELEAVVKEINSELEKKEQEDFDSLLDLIGDMKKNKDK